MYFNNSSINLEVLRKKAYNHRWASLSDKVIPLTAADPDFPVAPEIIEGIKKYIMDGYLSYGPFSGLDDFKKSVANHFNDNNKCQFSPEHILPVNSAANGMFLITQYLLKPGDEAIIFDPVDFLFKKTVENAGAKVRLCKIDTTNGEIDLDHLKTLISSQTKLICLCNPHNPLGTVYKKHTLEKIAQIALSNDIWVMSDEIWSDIIYDQHTHISYSTISKEAALKSFTIYGFSKSFGLAGLRIGAVLCRNESILKDFIEKSNFNSTIEGVSTISQVAASIALEKSKYWLKDFVIHLKENRDLAYKLINSSSVLETQLPEATYVMFPKIKNGFSSNEFTERVLSLGKVSVVPGNEQWFGPSANGHIRLCFSTSKEILTEGIQRIIKTFE